MQFLLIIFPLIFNFHRLSCLCSQNDGCNKYSSILQQMNDEQKNVAIQTAFKEFLLHKLNMTVRPDPDTVKRIRKDISSSSLNRLMKISNYYIENVKQSEVEDSSNTNVKSSYVIVFNGTQIAKSQCSFEETCVHFSLDYREKIDVKMQYDLDLFERYDIHSIMLIDNLIPVSNSFDVQSTNGLNVKLMALDDQNRIVSQIQLDRDEWSLNHFKSKYKMTLKLPLRFKYPFILANYTKITDIILKVEQLARFFQTARMDVKLSISYSYSLFVHEEKKIRQSRSIPNLKDCNLKQRCCLLTREVHFSEINWTDWIVAPLSISLKYCEGNCHFMHPHITLYNSLIRTLIQRYQKNSPKANLCCAPYSMNSLGLVYFNSQGNLADRMVPDVFAESCVCA